MGTLQLVLVALNKLFKSGNKNFLDGDSIIEKIHLKLFKVRVNVALFTIIYFILCLIFYFAYTAHFFN